MDSNCIYQRDQSFLSIAPFRFADHLKNTEYKWPFWKHWANVVQLQPDNVQRVFVSNVLAALVKLSYADRYEMVMAMVMAMAMTMTAFCSQDNCQDDFDHYHAKLLWLHPSSVGGTLRRPSPRRIKKTLPEALWQLLPLDPTPICPYLDGASGISANMQRIAGNARMCSFLYSGLLV